MQIAFGPPVAKVNARPRRRRRSGIACDVGVDNLVCRDPYFAFGYSCVRKRVSLGKRCIQVGRHMRELMRDFFFGVFSSDVVRTRPMLLVAN